MTLEQAKQHADRVSGISNVAYDLLAVLTNKLEGIAAIEEYKLDAQSVGDQEVIALFQRLEDHAREDVDALRGLVVSRLQHILFS